MNEKLPELIAFPVETFELKTLKQKQLINTLREREHQYHQLLQALPAATYTCDAEGRIQFYNKAAVELWGLEPEIGKDLWCGSWKIYKPDGSPLPLDECPMAVALREGRPVRGEEIIIERPDGQRCYVLPHPQPLFDTAGKVTGAVNMLVDITELKKADMALQERKEQFRQLAEFVPEIIWTATADGHVDYYNKQWYAYTGMEELFGDESWKRALHPDDVQDYHRKWYQAIQTGEYFQIECRFKDMRAAGTYRWFLSRALPIRDHHQQIVKWFGSCTDIHDHKTNMEQKDAFIGIASHELKTPLTSLKAYVQLIEKMLENYDDKNVKLFMQKANECIVRLNGLITDLLDVSKIQSGNLSIHFTEFDFDTFIREVTEAMKHTIPSHKLILTGQSNVKVYGDKERLEQVVVNYIANAVKYSPDADRVIIHLSPDSDQVQVAVKDFGIGIPANKITHLFERFYRVEDHAKKFQGLGLGLYISSEIIKLHKGKTRVESEEGRGSAFYFSIPVA